MGRPGRSPVIELSNLWIAIGAKTSGLASGIADATRIIGTFAANTKVQIAKINAAWAGFQEVSGMTKLIGGLTLLAAALVLSVGPAIQFESAFASVTKTVEGTPQQLAGIRQEILSMADSMPLAATKIAEVAATAGQLGIATQDVTAFTKVMVMLGTATDLTANQAATSMARFTNIMQIPIEKLPQLAAALVHLGNNSAATESEILTLGLRLAAAGTQLGLSGEQVLALSAAMKSLGITAEVGGSSMSRVLIDMVTAAGPKMDTFARVIGVTREEFQRLVAERSPEAAGQLVLGFVQGLQRIDEQGGSVRKVLQDLGLDSIRLRDTLIRLVAGGDQLAESFGLVSNASVYGGALLQEYSRFAETTASRLEILKNRLTGLAIDIGTPMLGGIATAADAIGDAVLKIQSILAPLASSLGDTFGNLGKGVQLFYDQLASPALTSAVAAFTGLAAVVNLLVGAFNALGPAGIIIGALLADLYLVGPVSVALEGFRLAVVNVGIASASAGLGLNLLKAGLQIAPLAVTVAGFVLLGKAMQDADKAANAMATTMKQDLAQSLEDGNWQQFTNRIEVIQARVEDLDGTLATNGLNWRNLGQILLGTAQLFSPMENTILNNKAELKELNGVLSDPNFGGNFRFNIKELADDLGISEQAAFNLVAATGKLEVAQKAGSNAFLEVKQAAKDYLAELSGIAGKSEEATASILDQQVSVKTLADLYDVSMGTIQQAMAEAKVTEADLLDPKKYEEVIDKIDAIVGPWQRIADASGQSADAVAREIAVTNSLIAAQKDLADAFDLVKQSRDAAEFPIQHLQEATKSYKEATDQFKAGDLALAEYAQSLQNLTAAQVAVAPSAAEATRIQAENADAFRKTAKAAGETDAAINEVLVRWGLLTATEVADLQIKGTDALDLARQKITELRDSMHDQIVAQMAVDMGTTEADIERALQRGETWATSEFEARMKAATEGPMRDIADLLVQAGLWDQTEAEAYLSGNFSDFEVALEVAKGRLETWKGPWVGILTADNSDALAREGAATAAAREYADGAYRASLTADNSDALGKTKQASDEANRYWTTPYQSRLTSDNSDALSKTGIAVEGANKYAAGKYQAILSSDNSDALNKTNSAAAEATKYGSMRPKSVLTAENSQAIGAIQAAIDRLSGFQSKTVTLTVRNVSIGVPVGASGTGTIRSADGNILRSYAAGGFENHQAQVARGQWPVRIWAEPETGGEAYIPLSPVKRARSTAILGTVANDFGYNLVPMAAGGIMRDQASLAAVMAAAGYRAIGENRYQRERLVNIHAPISLTMTAAQGVDPQEVARMVDVAARRALTQAGRQLANTRR